MEARPIRKVLIANRGEIALRVIRACRTRGLATVAVYSDADRAGLHVPAADEAYPIGGPAAAQSYLRITAIIEAALASGADAVHPGYGFLAENAAFAQACREAGLTFIGPPPEAIATCGDKAETRRAVRSAGVPVLPGTDPVSDEAAAGAAERLGFPLLIKAAAGGGGKGIHLVSRPEDLSGRLRLARGEAQGSFGDDRVYLERWVEHPRHIEVQILADGHGHVIHLGERECSIQRRHQKVIEETPSPAVTDGMRNEMGKTAVAAARAVGYRNAGTVEFLLAGRDFYFLEINARLQVEHPITEFVTGTDLVALQLAIAAGEPLPMRQEEVALHGHAIECRISAEDPASGFLPWTGRIGEVVLPGGPGIRIDSALVSEMEVTRFYDPLLAKLVAWGSHRDEAIARMIAALRETVITGLPTTIPFHLWALEHPLFRSGTYGTQFVDTEWSPRESVPPPGVLLAAAAFAHHLDRRPPLLPPQDAGAWRAAARREAVS
jgi:acetyl-CoA carboxylase biotin carboxylase subunit